MYNNSFVSDGVALSNEDGDGSVDDDDNDADDENME